MLNGGYCSAAWGLHLWHVRIKMRHDGTCACHPFSSKLDSRYKSPTLEQRVHERVCLCLLDTHCAPGEAPGECNLCEWVWNTLGECGTLPWNSRCYLLP